MRILGLDNVVIDVDDLDVARQFYTSVVGLQEKFVFPDPGLIGYRIGSEEPGLLVRVRPDAVNPEQHGPRVWFETPDARAAGAELREHGVALLGEPFRVRTGWAVEVADPFGNVIGLTDYVDSPALSRSDTDEETPRRPVERGTRPE